MSKWKDASRVLLTYAVLLGIASEVEGITLPLGFSDAAAADVAPPTDLGRSSAVTVIFGPHGLGWPARLALDDQVQERQA